MTEAEINGLKQAEAAMRLERDAALAELDDMRHAWAILREPDEARVPAMAAEGATLFRARLDEARRQVAALREACAKAMRLEHHSQPRYGQLKDEVQAAIEDTAATAAAHDERVRADERDKLKSFHAAWKAEVRAAALAEAAQHLEAPAAATLKRVTDRAMFVLAAHVVRALATAKPSEAAQVAEWVKTPGIACATCGESDVPCKSDGVVWTCRDCEQNYPCRECGAPRTKAQGGTTFTVCDVCWDKHVAKPAEVVFGCAHGRQVGQPCPHCMGINK